jgi:hypothetical protein
MGRICSCMFEQEDPENEGYSQTEVDLYGKTGLTLRKNIVLGTYEIVRISDKHLEHTFNSLESAVDKVNEIEGTLNLRVEHGGVGCMH